MPLSQEDVALLAQTVAQTVGAVPSAQPQGQQAQQQTGQVRGERVDDCHFRKLMAFGGEAWHDWSFQFLWTAYHLLMWAEKQESTIDPLEDFTEADEDTSTRISGEVFNIFVNTLKGEPCS